MTTTLWFLLWLLTPQTPASSVQGVVVRAGTTQPVKPASAITGTVFHPSGERAAAVRVQAFGTVYTPLGPRMRSVMSVATDDLGEFRLFWLRHGEYNISAGYSDRALSGAWRRRVYGLPELVQA